MNVIKVISKGVLLETILSSVPVFAPEGDKMVPLDPDPGSVNCRDCGEHMSLKEMDFFLMWGWVQEGNEALCLRCYRIRFEEEGETIEDLIAEFCG